MAELLYQGHASIRLETKDGFVCYIDPFMGEGYEKPADMILITHEHYDHNDVHKVKQKETTIIIRAADALQNGIYYDFSYGGIDIQATPACNAHHDRSECVGFLLKVEGKTIYIAGDSDYFPEMEELAKMELDYAFLPIDGIYNMGPEEATRVANILKPKHLVPYHMHPGMDFDIKQDMKVTYANTILVRPGDIVKL